MAQAIFGLIGVVIGAAVTGAVEWWRTRRESEIKGRAAARLVREELAGLTIALEVAADLESDARVAESVRSEIERGIYDALAWQEQRALLAELLTDDAWRLVTHAYYMVSLFRQYADSDDEQMANHVRSVLKEKELAEAENALRPHALRKLAKKRDS